jgi:hypothetical protein
MSEESPDRSTDPLLEPEDADSAPAPQSATPDPNDEIPVPIAMFPSEIDERAQVVETLRERERSADEPEAEETRPTDD